MHARSLVTCLGGALALLAGCSHQQASSGEPQYNIVRPNESAPQTGGVPPDKEAEIRLMLEQREPSARKCYQDVLNEKHDRSFAGTVQLLINVEPTGKAAQVKVVGGTLSDASVQECLVQTIRDFEFPQLTQAGQVQYTYSFRPAY
jgi:hypothetical protein